MWCKRCLLKRIREIRNRGVILQSPFNSTTAAGDEKQSPAAVSEALFSVSMAYFCRVRSRKFLSLRRRPRFQAGISWVVASSSFIAAMGTKWYPS